MKKRVKENYDNTANIQTSANGISNSEIVSMVCIICFFGLIIPWSGLWLLLTNNPNPSDGDKKLAIFFLIVSVLSIILPSLKLAGKI